MGVFQTAMFSGLEGDHLWVLVKRWVMVCCGTMKGKKGYQSATIFIFQMKT
jgi:hypothetical protein